MNCLNVDPPGNVLVLVDLVRNDIVQIRSVPSLVLDFTFGDRRAVKNLSLSILYLYIEFRVEVVAIRQTCGICEVRERSLIKIHH